MSGKSIRWPKKFPVIGKESGGGKDSVWLKLIPFILEEQNSDLRNKTSGLSVRQMNSSPIEFLMPNDFTETLNHEWVEHTGISGALATMMKSIGGSISDLSGITEGIANQNFASLLESTRQGQISKTRIDFALKYQNTARRELNLQFSLADQGDTFEDVFFPVHLLRMLSSASIAKSNAKISPQSQGTISTNQNFSKTAQKFNLNFGSSIGNFVGNDNLKIEWPNIFRLQTVDGDGKPNDMIYFDYAAIRSVQPQFKGPYRNGYPSQCDINITFVDLEPPFKSSFSSENLGSSKITTSKK